MSPKDFNGCGGRGKAARALAKDFERLRTPSLLAEQALGGGAVDHQLASPIGSRGTMGTDSPQLARCSGGGSIVFGAERRDGGAPSVYRAEVAEAGMVQFNDDTEVL